MKINKSIFEERVADKIKLLTLHSIVTECFMKALPISKNDMDLDEMRAISQYCYDVLEAAGGYSIIESAMVENKENPDRYRLLKRLNSACTEATQKATKRIVESANINDGLMEELIANAKLTNDEYDEFLNSKKECDLDRIAEIIKQKVIDTIRIEKETYEKNDELNQELTDALQSSDTTSEMSVESYLDLIMNETDVKEHKSFFSKIQEHACEACLFRCSTFDSLPIDLLTEITVESTLPIFNNDKPLTKILESLINIKDPEVIKSIDSDKVKACMALGTALATIIYTLFETLYTLNIIKPTTFDIKKFIQRKNNILDRQALDVEALDDKIEAEIKNIRSKISLCNNPLQLDEIKSELSCLSAKIASVNPEHISLSEINGLCDYASNRKSAVDSTAQTVDTPYTEMRKMEEAMQFKKIPRIIKTNPSVVTIKIMIPQQPNYRGPIDIIGVDQMGVPVFKTFANIGAYNYAPLSLTEYISILCKMTDLHQCNRSVILVKDDGSGKSTAL